MNKLHEPLRLQRTWKDKPFAREQTQSRRICRPKF